MEKKSYKVHKGTEMKKSRFTLFYTCVCSMILCAVCLVSFAWAWFSDEETAVGSINIASYNLEITVTNVTDSDNEQTVEATDSEKGIWALTGGNKYKIALTAGGTAQNGYCMMSGAITQAETEAVSETGAAAGEETLAVVPLTVVEDVSEATPEAISEEGSEDFAENQEEVSEAPVQLYTGNIPSGGSMSFYVVLEKEGSHMFEIISSWGTLPDSAIEDNIITEGKFVTVGTDGSIAIADNGVNSGTADGTDSDVSEGTETGSTGEASDGTEEGTGSEAEDEASDGTEEGTGSEAEDEASDSTEGTEGSDNGSDVSNGTGEGVGSETDGEASGDAGAGAEGSDNGGDVSNGTGEGVGSETDGEASGDAETGASGSKTDSNTGNGTEEGNDSSAEVAQAGEGDSNTNSNESAESTEETTN